MMKPVIMRVAIQNALLFVRDSKSNKIPDVDYGDGSSCWSIPTCVAIVGLVDCDGETRITIGSANQIEPERKLLFDGILETPSHALILETVHDSLLHVRLPSDRNRVRVWTDGKHRCAENVVIGIG